MCGSFQQPGSIRIFEEFARLTGSPLNRLLGAEAAGAGERTLRPFNEALVIFAGEDGGLKLAPIYWQLIHDWEKEFKSRYTCFNVRAESLDKPHNHKLLLSRRCIFPAAGFFENRHADGEPLRPRQVYKFSLPGQSLMALGGIYSVWTNPGNEQDRRLSAAIITVRPNPAVGKIHSRMPLIVPPERICGWLDPGLNDTEKIKEMIRPYEGRLEAERRS